MDEVQRTSWAAVGFGLLFLAVGVVMVVGSIGAYRLDSAIQRSGGSSLGTVIDKDFSFSADGDSDYQVTYTFLLADGGEMTGSQLVSKRFYESVERGDQITIHYLRSNPGRNFPTDQGVTSLGLTVFVSAMGAVFAAVGVALLTFFRRLDQLPAKAQFRGRP